MLSAGKLFSLGKATVAVELIDGKRTVVQIPIGGIVEALPGFKVGDIMVDVLWENRVVHMFAVDLLARGTELSSHQNSIKAQTPSAAKT